MFRAISLDRGRKAKVGDLGAPVPAAFECETANGHAVRHSLVEGGQARSGDARPCPSRLRASIAGRVGDKYSPIDVDRKWRNCGGNYDCLRFNHRWERAGFWALFQCGKFFELFAKRLLTLELCPNYIPATGDDVASRAAVQWRLSSRFDFVHGLLAKSQAEDFVSLK